MEIKTKTRKWGNSLGVILPKLVVESRKIRENDEIVIKIIKQPILSKLFGKFPRTSKKTAQEIKDEARKGWD